MADEGKELVAVSLAAVSVTGIFGVIVAWISRATPKVLKEKTTVETLKIAVDGMGVALDHMRLEHETCKEELSELREWGYEVEKAMAQPIPPYIFRGRPTFLGVRRDEK